MTAGDRKWGLATGREETAASPPVPSSQSPVPERPSAARVWLSAARLKTLPAAAAPVALGTAFAWGDGAFHAAAAACALVSALLIQVGTNYANDAEDAARGADTAARVGPKRAVNEGWVTAGQMRRAAAAAFGLAFLSGLYLVWRGGLPVLALGLVAIASGVGYTKGRYALAYTGLADVFVLVFFGPVAVGGTYFVQALALPAWVLIAGLGPGALATAILVANNVRDVEQDRAADKRTLVVRFGRGFGVTLYGSCFVLAGLVVRLPALMARQLDMDRLREVVPSDPEARRALWEQTGGSAHVGALAAVAVAYVGLFLLVPALSRAHGAAAAPILGKTAAVLMLYSLAFALGWVLT